MAGAAGEGGLRAGGLSRGDGAVRFALATPADDAELRRLLRENPMKGRISISLEREPSYFAAAAIEGEHQTIVAYEGDRVVCAGSVSARERFINGKAMRVGYLGGLRLDSSCRGRTSIVRRGYEMFRKLHEAGGPPIYLTSIAEDNEPARRLLEAGIRGMPTYRFLGKLVTFVVRPDALDAFPATWREWRRKVRTEHATSEEMAELESLLRRAASAYQFAPVWSASELSSPAHCPGLRPASFSTVRSVEGNLLACAAVWDQRAFKQAVVRGYPPLLRRFRWLINAICRIERHVPRLPPIGSCIRSAYISHFAVEKEESDLVRAVLGHVQMEAYSKKIAHSIIAFDERDPRIKLLRDMMYGARRYVTRLYAVHWDDGAELAASLDDRLLAPEVAIL
jgi:hypothetical protein